MKQMRLVVLVYVSIVIFTQLMIGLSNSNSIKNSRQASKLQLKLLTTNHHRRREIAEINEKNNDWQQQQQQPKIVFIAPKESQRIYQFNNLKEWLFGKRLFKGWYIEANKRTTFTLYLATAAYNYKQSQSSNYSSNNNNSQSSELRTFNSTKNLNNNTNSTAALVQTIIRNYRSRIYHQSAAQSGVSDQQKFTKKFFYFYFTLNPFNCHDYAIHSHTPIIIREERSSLSFNESNNRLYKIDVDVNLKHSPTGSYFICLKYENPLLTLLKLNSENDYDSSMLGFIHQGTQPQLSINTFEYILPLWFIIAIYTVLVLLNSIFNGLNLGLMSLSIEELNLLVKASESDLERKYAQNILPLRQKGNFLLCSILISIAFTSSVSTLILDDLVHGFLAGAISTIVLCLIGEILPQALCSKYSLPIGSYTRRFTYFFICITSIFSYPLSKIVDYCLGKEVPTKYNRESIKELVKISQGLHEKQCKIISGALDLKSKHVSDIMVPLDQVYMLQENAKLNFETIVTIYNSGFSRVPVYQMGSRESLVGWFHIKDLTLIDPDDEIEVKSLLAVFNRPLTFCHSTDSLTDLFDLFRMGTTHMAFVLELVQNTNTDPYEKFVGILTLHDVIEALLQFDIYDELVNSVHHSRGMKYLMKIIENSKHKTILKQQPGAEEMAENSNEEILSGAAAIAKQQSLLVLPTISTQTKLVLFQILATLEPFKEEFIDRGVLEKLVNDEKNIVNKYLMITKSDDVNFAETAEPYDRTSSSAATATTNSNYVYTYGKPCEFFVVIIEGTLTLEAGKEKFEVFTKQFDHFGTRALLGECDNVNDVLENQPPYKPYMPEFSLRIDYEKHLFSSIGDSKIKLLSYFRLDRKQWLNAVRATHIKRSQSSLANLNTSLSISDF